MSYVLVYLVSVPVFFAIDMLWLGFVASSFYKAQLGSLLGPVNWSVAILFYLLFLVGLIIFAIAPALQDRSIGTALLYGALFGFFTYMTYDLTNLSTIRDWPWSLSFVDIAWGTVLSAAVASITYWLSITFIVK